MNDFATVKAAATGREPEILQYILGCSPDVFNGKHQPCIGCGGEDRYRWAGDHWFCGQGGVTTGGDLFDLLVHCGRSKADALHAVAYYLNLDRVMYSPEQRQEIQRKQDDNKLAQREELLQHELHVHLQIVGKRVSDRLNATDPKFRAANPNCKSIVSEHREREIEAALNITSIIRALYPEVT